MKQEERLPREQWLMAMADIIAQRSTCNRLRVGALIVRSHRIVSTGYNGNVSGMPHCDHPGDSSRCETAVHAEANALVFAARTGLSTEGASLVTTHQPCLECAKLIVNAGISQVRFRDTYRSDDGLTLLREAGVQVCRSA